jgi:multidrug efflux pump subunit AcrA (membrane-fusion protein)
VAKTQDGRAPKVSTGADTEVSSQTKRTSRFAPTPAQWAALGMEPVKNMTFRSEHMTEGKISINEDKATPIFPPYVGRVTRLMAKPGDTVKRGEPLFYIEAADMVQAQNDFLTALAAINRAKSRVTITEIIEKQNRTLYESKAGALRDFQTATADLAQARADLRTAESSLEAARNRLADHGIVDRREKRCFANILEYRPADTRAAAPRPMMLPSLDPPTRERLVEAKRRPLADANAKQFVRPQLAGDLVGRHSVVRLSAASKPTTTHREVVPPVRQALAAEDTHVVASSRKRSRSCSR